MLKLIRSAFKNMEVTFDESPYAAQLSRNPSSSVPTSALSGSNTVVQYHHDFRNPSHADRSRAKTKGLRDPEASVNSAKST
jgi:hypothetical protein